MSQPFKLYRLQQVDSQLDQAHARLKEIETALGDDTTLRRIETEFAAAEAVLAEAEKNQRSAEAEVQGQEAKVEQNQTALYGGAVKNPKELEELQMESAALKRHLSALEDRQLEAMMVVEEAESERDTAQAALDEERARSAESNADLTAEQSNLRSDVERLDSEREATASDIPAEDLRIYEKLRIQRGGIAVARLSDSACMACGANLSSSQAQEARSPNKLTNCYSCGRILYGG